MKSNISAYLLGLALLVSLMSASVVWATNGPGRWLNGTTNIDCPQGTVCVDWLRLSEQRVVFTCCIDLAEESWNDPASCVEGTLTMRPISMGGSPLAI